MADLDTDAPDRTGLSELRIGLGGGLWLTLEYPTDWQLFDEQATIRTAMAATEIYAMAMVTMLKKDQHYAGAWREQGWRGNVARILSKAARLKSMLWRTKPAENVAEPVADTLLDLINLAVFATLNRQSGNEWGQGRA